MMKENKTAIIDTGIVADLLHRNPGDSSAQRLATWAAHLLCTHAAQAQETVGFIAEHGSTDAVRDAATSSQRELEAEYRAMIQVMAAPLTRSLKKTAGTAVCAARSTLKFLQAYYG